MILSTTNIKAITLTFFDKSLDKEIMKSILYFLLILFLEISCGIALAFLYWFLSSLLFDKDGFGRSKINELMYYIITLLLPFIYCWIEYSRFKKKGLRDNSVIYLSAGLTYLIGGLIFILILTDFYLFRK